MLRVVVFCGVVSCGGGFCAGPNISFPLKTVQLTWWCFFLKLSGRCGGSVLCGGLFCGVVLWRCFLCWCLMIAFLAVFCFGSSRT